MDTPVGASTDTPLSVPVQLPSSDYYRYQNSKEAN